MTIRLRVATVVAALLLTAACGGDPEPAAEPTPAAVSPTTPAAVAPADQPASPAAPESPIKPRGLRDWIYKIGEEIQPDTYVTVAPADHACYWARLRSFGEANSIIEDNNVEPGESAEVTVRSTDAGFKVSNGCTWYPSP